ncbi:TPA: PcfJ domain-containing protein [Streptococcus suis]
MTQTIQNGKEHFLFDIINLELYREGKRYNVTKIGDTWVKGKTPIYPASCHRKVFYLPMKWQERGKFNDDLKYLYLYPDEEIDIDIIYHIYKYRDRIEFCQKIGANILAKQIIGDYTYRFYGFHHTKPDMRKVTMKWLKKNKSFFRNSDRGLDIFYLAQAIEERGAKYVPGIERYLSLQDLSRIPENVGLLKFQNWIIKQKIKFQDYSDYLRMLDRLGVNTVSKRILLPANFKKAHDDAIMAYNAYLKEKKNESERRRNHSYIQRLDELLKMETSIDDFSFIVPKSIEEIIKEGYAQNHCVASYAGQVSRGETTIIFVRSTDTPDKPLYTMEVNNGRIIQLRGHHNVSASEDAIKAAEKYIEWLSKKKIFG